MIAWLLILAIIAAALHAPLELSWGIFYASLLMYLIEEVRAKRVSPYLVPLAFLPLLLAYIHLPRGHNLPGLFQLLMMLSAAFLLSCIAAGVRMVAMRATREKKKK